MNWTPLVQHGQLKEVMETSKDHPIVVFKHSTRCPISTMALSRLERTWDNAAVPNTQAYYLDLIKYREISNQIAEDLGVEHQSPQVIIIYDGKAVYDESHMDIRFESIHKIVNGFALKSQN